MELAGEEKRIQALFSETSHYDRSSAPKFERLWARAEAVKSVTAPISSRLVLAIASVVLIVAASAFAAWSWYRATPTTTQHDAKIAPVVTPLPQPAPQLAQNSQRAVETRIHPTHQKRLARAPRAQRAALNEAALLSSWQSPTQLLMQFSKTVDLSSLPQLNQSVEALKQFLPANADLKKESNQ
jgi:hypothetical protein